MAKRTGLRTLHNLAKTMCQLFATWKPAILAIVPADKHLYVNALSQACDDFVLNVSVSAILGDESP